MSKAWKEKFFELLLDGVVGGGGAGPHFCLIFKGYSFFVGNF